MLPLNTEKQLLQAPEYFSSIYSWLDIDEEKQKEFLKEFDDFFKSLDQNMSLPLFIVTIRNFLKEKRPLVQKLFSGTLLSNYECLTQCILAWIILEKHGYDFQLARPSELYRYFHVLLVDNEKRKFKMVGKRKVYGYEILSWEEAVQQLKYTHPIVSYSKKVKNIIQKLLP